MTKQEVLQAAGLDWEVREIGLRTDEENSIVIPKTKSILRITPEGQDDIYLGIHKAGYELFQNEELIEVLMKATEIVGGDVELHSGGMFGDGQKVFVQMKTDDLTMPNGDKVKGFITGINSFDGGTSLGFGNSTKTISCQNSFWYAYHELDTKIRHTTRLRERVEEVVQKFVILMEEEQKHFAMINRLSQVQIDPEVQSMVTRMLFDLNLQERWEDLSKDFSTRKKNQLREFNTDLNMEKIDKGENLWGLFSGVTRYTTHTMKKTGDNTKAKMIGNTGRKERRIWEALSEHVY